MTTSISTSSTSDDQKTETYVQTLLEAARPFIRGELEKVNEKLPSLVAALRSVGAGECHHKQGSFLQHLMDVYRILKIWNVPDVVCLCGLFHSAYSNSYVNLALFDIQTDRDTVQKYVGVAAERLIHLFCVVPRKPLIHDHLRFQYTESELVDHLKMSENSIKTLKEKGVLSGREEEWRVKVNSLVPEEGLLVKSHFKEDEEIRVSRRVVAIFMLMTIADASDQLFSFQDVLFENHDGVRDCKGSNIHSLWPGEAKPGLWMHCLSKMAAIYTLLVREEEMLISERRIDGVDCKVEGRDEEIELVMPPVFEMCRRVLEPGKEIEARDSYWEAVCDHGKIGMDKTEELLLKSIEMNPFAGEPHVVLAQLYLGKGMFEEAESEAQKGLVLLLEWGSPWDKRMSREGWIAWVRVLLMKAKENSWPQTAWGIINLGLVG